MADKGFDIGELLKSRKLKLNHPPYLRDKRPFSPDEVVETPRIASLRIHVERAIERIKGKLHSKIISSDMKDFSVQSDGEGPRSKFEQEDGQTDSGKTGTCEHV